MSLDIRPANGADSPAVAALVKAVFEEYGFAWDEDDYCADLYDLQSHYLEQGHQFWVAEEDGKIVGCVGLEVYDLVPGNVGSTELVRGKVRAGGSDCSLERMYVHPEARGQGLGKELMKITVDAARRAGRSAMEIWSDKKLETAHLLYSKFGAIKIGDRTCDDPDESPEWGFVLPLT